METQMHSCSLICNKGCGTQIYFDPNNKSSSGKMIPMEIATHKNMLVVGGSRKKWIFLFDAVGFRFVYSLRQHYPGMLEGIAPAEVQAFLHD